jgi:hypothetical protein
MLKDFPDIEFVFPEKFNQEDFFGYFPLEPFSDECIEYLNCLSASLSRNPAIKLFPDVATFDFFCRKANLLNLKKKFCNEENLKLGRGIAFHIAPSNVPVNFAYSMVCGLLAGNTNIVRIPSKDFEQVNIICNAIKDLSNINKLREMSLRTIFVKYDKRSNATGYFSSICDVRIIWGGDETIAQVRKHAIPPRSFDITFADRYSFCAINAEKYISDCDFEKTAKAFYNDTYMFDQNACTASHLVLWFGNDENIRIAKEIFWNTLYKIVKSRYNMQPVIAVNKLTSLYTQAVHLGKIKKETSVDNLLWRISLTDLPADIENFRCNSGYFSEYSLKRLEDITHIVSRKYQTLAYFGFNKQELRNLISKIKPVGIDRIVPIGRTTDFSLIWDGYNMIEVLSRNIEIIQ